MVAPSSLARTVCFARHFDAAQDHTRSEVPDMTCTDHEPAQSNGDVMSALKDAKAAFQPGWERLYEAFDVAVFELLASLVVTAPEVARVDRILVTYCTMLDDVDVAFLDVNDEPVDIRMPSELAALLLEAHGYLNFSTFMPTSAPDNVRVAVAARVSRRWGTAGYHREQVVCPRRMMAAVGPHAASDRGFDTGAAPRDAVGHPPALPAPASGHPSHETAA